MDSGWIQGGFLMDSDWIRMLNGLLVDSGLILFWILGLDFVWSRNHTNRLARFLKLAGRKGTRACAYFGRSLDEMLKFQVDFASFHELDRSR